MLAVKLVCEHKLNNQGAGTRDTRGVRKKNPVTSRQKEERSDETYEQQYPLPAIESRGCGRSPDFQALSPFRDAQRQC